VNGFSDQPSSVSLASSFLQPFDVVCFVLIFCPHLFGCFPVDSCRSASLTHTLLLVSQTGGDGSCLAFLQLHDQRQPAHGQ
jgi:hypothetical protein